MLALDKFIVYVEEIESLKELSNEEIGIFFRAVTEYVKSGIVPNLPERLIFPFRFITAHISRDQKKYKDISEKRKIAGRKGLDSRMKNSESGLSEENEKYVGSVEQCIEETEQCVESVEQCIGETKQLVGRVEQCIGETKQLVGSVGQCIGETKQLVGNVEQCIGETEQCVGSVEQCIGETEQCVESVEQCIGETEQCVGSVELRGWFEKNGENIREDFKENSEINIGESFKEDTETNKEENFEKKCGRNIKECFEEFWDEYPNKTGRNGAAVEYMCMFTGNKSHSEIMNVLNDFKKSEEWKKGDGTNVPTPQKWLSDLKKFGDKHFIFSSS